MLTWLKNWRQRRKALNELDSMEKREIQLAVIRFDDLIFDAKDAILRGNVKSATTLFEKIRSHVPDKAVTSAAFIQIGIDVKRYDDLEAMLQAASPRQKRNANWAEGLAKVAQARGDFDLAIARWANVRQHHPRRATGYSQGAAVLMRGKRLDEAASILKAGIRRLPRDMTCRLELARLAMEQKDWDEALRRWTQLQNMFPGTNTLAYELGTLGLGQCLRAMQRFDEAEPLLTDVTQRYPSGIGPFIELARIAEDRGDWQEATTRWGTVARRFPTTPFGYSGQADAMRRAGNPDEADRVLLDGAEHLHDDPEMLIRYAKAAATSNPHEAARRWQMVRERFPEHESGFTGEADATPPVDQPTEGKVAEKGAQEEQDMVAQVIVADQLQEHPEMIRAFLMELTKQHPEDAALLENMSSADNVNRADFFLQAIQIAAKYKYWEAVEDIADHLRTLNGLSPRVYSEQFDALWNLGRHEEAEAILEEGVARFPHAHEVTVKRARLATMQHDYGSAARRWIDVQRTYPMIRESYDSGAFCLRQTGDIPAALAFLQIGIDRFPESIDLWLQYIEIALNVSDVSSARASWAAHHSSFPDDCRAPLAGARIAFAGEELNLAASLLKESITLNNGCANKEQSDLQKRLTDFEIRSMAMNFESLGGRMEGCEFGLFQRVYAAEPLGLLRWSDMAPDALIDALEHDFEGVGEPEDTVLSSPHAPGADWSTQSRRYGMNMHTFQYDPPTEETRSRLFQRAVRRLQYLKRKMLDDLASGDKVLVYKVTYEVLSDERLDRLFRAIRRYGPSTLLYVRQPDGDHRAGTVEWARPGLLLGYIERFSYGFGHGAPLIGPATECWEVIVRRAYQMWLSGSDH